MTGSGLHPSTGCKPEGKKKLLLIQRLHAIYCWLVRGNSVERSVLLTSCTTYGHPGAILLAAMENRSRWTFWTQLSRTLLTALILYHRVPCSRNTVCTGRDRFLQRLHSGSCRRPPHSTPAHFGGIFGSLPGLVWCVHAWSYTFQTSINWSLPVFVITGNICSQLSGGNTKD